MRLILALLLGVALPAFAQGLPSGATASADAMLDALAGRTVAMYAAQSGAFVGLEHFLTRDRSHWRRSDGTCAVGTVTAAAGHICFRYDDAPGQKYCWAPVDVNGEPGYRMLGTGETQIIRDPGGATVDCTVVPLS